LEGVDKDWVYAGTRRYASYTNLQGGDYVFKVKASNNDGLWSEKETTLRIHITPPFWKTWWFIGIVAMTLVISGVGAYRLRVRDMEIMNRELATRVEQRTSELAALNTIATVVDRSLDLHEILNSALDQTLALMHLDIGLAFRLEEQSGDPAKGPVLSLLAHRGLSDEFVQSVQSLPLHKTMIGPAAEHSAPVVWDNANYPTPEIQAANEKEGIRLGISIPLLVKGNLVGSVSLGAREMRVMKPEELSLLAAIGQQVGMAVENARLYEQAERTAAMSERSRLARELHDSVTQLIYSVTLYAEAASELLGSGETKTAADHLRELRDTAQEALREMRLLIFELRRPALDESGLAGALQARLDAVESHGGMQAELQVEGSEAITRLVQEELYNIAQEALNNALKHARASRICVRLCYGETATVLEITDDGVGFEPTSDRLGGGFGISGMKERAQKIGGTLQIDSTPGKGTKVTVRVPAGSSGHPNQTVGGSSEEKTEE
jgi:signal transduction histidine kinase